MQTLVFGEATYCMVAKNYLSDFEILTFQNQIGVYNYKNSRILYLLHFYIF